VTRSPQAPCPLQVAASVATPSLHDASRQGTSEPTEPLH